MVSFGWIAGHTVSLTQQRRVDWIDESGRSQVGMWVENDWGRNMCLSSPREEMPSRVSATLASFSSSEVIAYYESHWHQWPAVCQGLCATAAFFKNLKKDSLPLHSDR